MLRKGFLRFHRAAEAGGNPALLLVTLVALAIIVSAIALLAIIKSSWALAFALMCLIGSVAIVAGGIDALFSDVEEPPAEPGRVSPVGRVRLLGAPGCAQIPIPDLPPKRDHRDMPQIAIRCHRCAPVAADEVEQWLAGELERLRDDAPRAVLRLLRLTQQAPTGEVEIGWLIELEAASGAPEFDGETLAPVVRDLRLLGLQPTVLQEKQA
jgi:hypothetical protein